MNDNKNSPSFKEKDFDPDNFESKQPKAVLIEFLQNTDKEKTLFTFTVKGSRTVAANFVHCIRVELSRLRRAAISAGRTPLHFKILKKSIKYDQETKSCEVILLRQTEKTISPEVNEMLDTFCMPEDI